MTVLSCFLPGASAWGAELPADPSPRKSPANRIAIAWVGGSTDSNLLAHIRSHLALNYGAPVEIKAVPVSTNATVERQLERLAASLASDEALLIALADSSADPSLHLMSLPSIRTVVLNLHPLRPRATAPDTARRYEHRVEKESMRAVAVYLGLPECPEWRCAASAWTTEAELDRKGRNLCPPCRMASAKFLRRMGVPAEEP